MSDSAGGAINPRTRSEALRRFHEQEFDVAIVGGGVVGAGAALDAATRGLSVALVEARDLASGTSSRSSKLIHGGLRYLEQLDFALVKEALHERALLLDRIAPHLVHPLPFLALLSHRGWERPYIGAGLVLYDTMGTALGRARGVPAQKHYTRTQTLKKFPALKKDSFTGAIQYYDAQVDDARHTMFLARTAAAYGAQVATRAQAVGFLREGEHVTGVKVVDLESGDHDSIIELRARQTINATGVWTDDTQDMVGARGQFHVRASKGVHLLVPRDRIHGDTALTIRTETSVLFVIPWGRHWIVGTTDTDWTLDKAHPAASKKDIDYLLDHVNRYLVTPLGHDDVEGVYAGLRPLLAGESDQTSALSREHIVAHPVPGLVAVAGGKYTTYRVMAADAVDAAVHGLEEEISPSITERVGLLGADGYLARWNARHRIAESSGVHVARIEHLLRRYGALIDDLLALIAEDPSLGEALPGSDDYLKVEVVYAATHEGAAHLEDVLTRRTRTSIETWDRGLSAAEPAARLMAGPLGWDEAHVAREVEHYTARVRAERQSQEQDDDLGADAARLGAPDVAPVLPVERLTDRNTRSGATGTPAGAETSHAGEPVAPRGA
ncbi:MAG TPA: glycerol-3-phosphate dehydrogenase/oxidase [Baekduia sp.]|uniref:glycerol-3-phosphate dehydrogenase/oxidase n=1 Tax=Baekduia sp. TaxID=2600305 RepID=UPI002D78DDFD|nr:glycerol-3-phosphate dehydrogenase/oxidase [Baekduia sp.]HET6509627.1 glycerol-3-phosphate dehydrogenase/oxidase [Baekduia sp.]